MALDELGLSFLPRGGGQDPASPGSGRRLEDILRVLSFRLPRVLGARPIAPSELLNAPGGAGGNAGVPLGSAVAQSIVQSILRGSPGGGPEAAPAPTTAPGAPSPLSQFFAPAFGPGAVQGPANLPAPSPTPRIIPIGPGTTAGPDPNAPGGEPGGGGGFLSAFSDVDAQLRRTNRRIV